MIRIPKSRERGIGAVELLEQATVLLRTAPLEALACYYLGTLPFVLGLLWFWADMSRSPDAHRHLAGGALGLAILFIVMKVGQARFSSRLLGQLDGTCQPAPLDSSILLQGALQPWGLVVLPLAGLLTLPLGWCYAFFQNITVLGGADLRSAYRHAQRQALLWPGQNHLLLVLLSLIGLVLFVNIAVSAYLLPKAVKTLFGIESIFTRSNLLLLNSTFWATVAALTHLCLDPLVKAAYVLRCHYGQSLASGADLRAQLRSLSSRAPLPLAGLMLAALLAYSGPVCAAQTPQPLQQRAHQLDRTIEQVVTSPRYSWRLPRDTSRLERQQLPGFLQASLAWLQDTAATVARWVRDLLNWVAAKLPKPDLPGPGKAWGAGFREHALPLLYALLALLLPAAAIMLWRQRRAPGPPPEPETHATVLTPDLHDESLTADELTEERWSTLAGELLTRGELRLGLRALYLSTLAALAEARLVVIARCKTNRDYERELLRFSHARPALAEAFTGNLRIFEGAWYGLHLPDETTLRHYLTNHRLIIGELHGP